MPGGICLARVLPLRKPQRPSVKFSPSLPDSGRQRCHRFGGRQAVQIEVSPDTLTLALNALEATSGLAPVTAVDPVSADRDTIKLSNVDRQQIPKLVAQLAAAGVHIFRVTGEEPSLEDIYFALHEKSESGTEEAPG